MIEPIRAVAEKINDYPYRLRIVVPGRPKMNQKLHWFAENQERKHWREMVFFLVPPALRPPTPLQRSSVHFDGWRSGRRPDRVNFEASMKPLLDALQPPQKTAKGFSVGCSVIVDDSPKHCEDTYEWHQARRGEDRVVITVTEA